MVSAADHPGKPGLHHAHDGVAERPPKRRFRLFAALTAPFQDMDERALHKKRAGSVVRNNSKGNLLATSAAAPANVPIRRFPRSGD